MSELGNAITRSRTFTTLSSVNTLSCFSHKQTWDPHFLFQTTVTSAQKGLTSAVMSPVPSWPHTRSQVPAKESLWDLVIHGWSVQVGTISTEGNLTKLIEIANTCTLCPGRPPPRVCHRYAASAQIYRNPNAGRVIATFGSKSRG